MEQSFKTKYYYVSDKEVEMMVYSTETEMERIIADVKVLLAAGGTIGATFTSVSITPIKFCGTHEQWMTDINGGDYDTWLNWIDQYCVDMHFDMLKHREPVLIVGYDEKYYYGYVNRFQHDFDHRCSFESETLGVVRPSEVRAWYPFEYMTILNMVTKLPMQKECPLVGYVTHDLHDIVDVPHYQISDWLT